MSLFLDYRSYWLLVYLGILATTFVFIALRKRPWAALGIGLMTAPLWMAFIGFLDSIPVILDRGSDIGTASRAQLSRMYYRSLVRDIGYLGVGFLLWSTDGRPYLALRDGVQGLARRLRESGLPLRREATSIGAGWLAFPALLAAAVAFDWLVSRGLPSTGTEDSFFALMTPYHAVMISLAAAFTEELAYRGVMMVGLVRLMGGLRPGPTRCGAWLTAIGLQALLFGLAHGGYGTIQHILVPLGFGLVAGLVAWRLGIWAAITLHFLVDLYAFGAETAATSPAFWGVLVTLLMANTLFSGGWAVRWTWLRMRARRTL